MKRVIRAALRLVLAGGLAMAALGVVRGLRGTDPVLAGAMSGAPPGVVAAPGAAVAGSALRVPAGLPAHVGLGAIAGMPDGSVHPWLASTGAPWDYASMVLSGGVNTGRGWRTSPADGRRAARFASAAAGRRHVPVLTYAQLLESAGGCDAACPEHVRMLGNLNDAGLMAQYYADFAALMQQLGAQGGRAIVHVEPDLSGYAMQGALDPGRCAGFCLASGNDPAAVAASVASSGVPALAGLPDTYQGFSWAMLRLRDQHAPNVLLAFHVSPWGPISDVAVSKLPSLDAPALGEAAGHFAALSGVQQAPPGSSTYDLLFTDVSRRDAGLAQAVQGEAVWWDRLNVGYPNFHRWEQFTGSVVRRAGTPMLVWRVPVGNQQLRTMDNTPGHYQDNRAEYFFEHLDELAGVGIVGLLFGSGTPGGTSPYDAAGDGVTNPAPRCAKEGVSSGAVCLERVADVADDDGGFLRQAAQRYYQGGGYPAPAAVSAGGAMVWQPLRVTLRPASVRPGLVKTASQVTVTQTVTATRDAALLVDFELYNGAGQRVWQAASPSQPVAAGQAVGVSQTIDMPSLPPGRYTLQTGVFTDNWDTLFVWSERAGTLIVGDALASEPFAPAGTAGSGSGGSAPAGGSPAGGGGAAAQAGASPVGQEQHTLVER